jgi:hypothetical protein
MASFSGGSRAFQLAVLRSELLGSESRNLLTNFSEFVRVFPSAVIFIKQPFLESKDLRISSRDEEIPSQSWSTFSSRAFKNSR